MLVGLEGSSSKAKQKGLQGNSAGSSGGLQKVGRSTLTSIILAGGFRPPLGAGEKSKVGYAVFEFTSDPVAVTTH